MWPILFRNRRPGHQSKQDGVAQFQTGIEPADYVVACVGRVPDYESVNLLAMAVSINLCYCFFEILLAVLANITDADTVDLVVVADLDFCSVSACLSYGFKLRIDFHLSL